jgi:hypothetical protein
MAVLCVGGRRSGKYVAKRAQVFDVPEVMNRFGMVNVGLAPR